MANTLIYVAYVVHIHTEFWLDDAIVGTRKVVVSLILQNVSFLITNPMFETPWLIFVSPTGKLEYTIVFLYIVRPSTHLYGVAFSDVE